MSDFILKIRLFPKDRSSMRVSEYRSTTKMGVGRDDGNEVDDATMVHSCSDRLIDGPDSSTKSNGCL